MIPVRDFCVCLLPLDRAGRDDGDWPWPVDANRLSQLREQYRRDRAVRNRQKGLVARKFFCLFCVRCTYGTLADDS